MSECLIRGRVLSFKERPEAHDDSSAFDYIEDGALHVVDGKIAAIGSFADIRRRVDGKVTLFDHQPHLLVPGFIDPHLHMPQMQIVGSYGAKLLDWLNQYVFVEEQRFGERGHAARIASALFDELIRNGTTTAAAFCSVHSASADAYFEEAAARDMLMVGGRVMMDRLAPEGLRDTPQAGYDETRALIARWQGKGRAHYASPGLPGDWRFPQHVPLNRPSPRPLRRRPHPVRHLLDRAEAGPRAASQRRWPRGDAAIP